MGGDKRVGVIDIGSNSVRLVLFDGPWRAPTTLFNEKTLCGLGAAVAQTGRLDPQAMADAETAVRRYAAVARGMGVRRLRPIATAAAREAENGAAFAERLSAILDAPVDILSGAQEARLAALGVLSGFPAAAGLIGDLGGGSLELAVVDGRRLAEGEDACFGESTTLPIGPLALGGHAWSEAEIDREIDARLDDAPWVLGLRDSQPDLAFFPVGGAWRSLAKLHMAHTHYPLRVIHHYTMPGDAAAAFAHEVATMSRSAIQATKAVSRRRAEILPLTARILARTLDKVRPAEVVFSAFGLREGAIFEMLDAKTRMLDPLADIVRRISDDLSRNPDMPDALMRFLDPVFESRESAADRRLRAGAVGLSDIAWRQHPDYRADVAFTRVLLAPVSGVDHAERAFMALAVHNRYGGSSSAAAASPARKLLDADRRAQAEALGKLLRLGYAYAAAAPDLLKAAHLDRDEDTLRLNAPAAHAALIGETVLRRLEQAAKALDLEAQVRCDA